MQRKLISCLDLIVTLRDPSTNRLFHAWHSILQVIARVPILFARWIDAFWGYDVFIAHRRMDAAAVAEALRDRLRRDEISSFLDKVEYGPGDNLYLATRRHVRKSSILVVVGSPQLLVPRLPIDWVAWELETYLETHSKEPLILVLDFGRQIGATLENCDKIRPCPPYVESLRHQLHLELPADIAQLDAEILDEVVSAVRRLLRRRRRDRSRLFFFQVVAALLLMLTIIASGSAFLSMMQRDAALASQAEVLARQARAATIKWPEQGVAYALAALPNPDGPPRPFRRPVQTTALAALSDALLQLGASRYLRFVDNASATTTVFETTDAGRLIVVLDSPSQMNDANDYAALLKISEQSNDPSILRSGREAREVASNGRELLAFANEVHEIVLINKTLGSFVAKLKHDAGPIWSIALNGSSTLVASGGGRDDGSARLWSITERKVLAQKRFDGSGIAELKFVPSASNLLVQTEQSAYLWHPLQDSPPIKLTSPGQLVRAIDVSRKGDRIAVATADGVVKVWSMLDQSKIFEVKAFGDLDAITFSPDGKSLAAVGPAGEARLYNVLGDPKKFITLYHETHTLLRDIVASGRPLLRSTVFPDNGDIVVTTADGGDVRVWRSSNGRLLKEIDVSPDTYNSSSLDAVGATPFGRVAGGYQGTAFILDVRAGIEQLRLDAGVGPITVANISPDGRKIAVMYEDFHAVFWDASTGARLTEISEEVGSTFKAVFDRKGRTFVTGSYDHVAKQWDTQDGTRLATYQDYGRLNDVAVSADGVFVATASDKGASVWSGGSETPLLRIAAPEGIEFTHVAFAIDCAFFLAGRSDGVLEIWSVSDKQRRFHSRPIAESINHLAISPEGTLAALGFENGVIILLDIKSGDERMRIDVRDDAVQSLNFAPNGMTLAAGRINGSVDLLRVNDGASIATLSSAGGQFPGTAFSPDGTLLVTFSAYGDSIVRVWDTASGELISTLSAHDRSVVAASFFPSGDRFFTASTDGTVLVWRSPPAINDWAKLVRAGCAALEDYPPMLGGRDQAKPPYVGQKPQSCE